MADEDILAGVPDDVQLDDDEMVMEAAEEAAEDAEQEAAQRAAARARQSAAEAEEDEREAARARQEAAEAEDDAAMQAEGGDASLPKRSGKRKIIHHTLDPSLLHGGVGGGTIAADEEELERRKARAAKFEVPLVEPVASGPPAMVDPAKMLTMEEIARREERAKKWEVNLEEKKWDPLAAIATASGPKAFWEKRRDASPDEQPRPEAIHAFGTDRMSTEDLMLYFIEPGVTTEEDAPQWVEWVNDSSANVVFGSADAAAAAMAVRTVALLPSAHGIDTQSWRTMPESLMAAGKGLQLLFRLASYKDVKPAKRAASRWYGESEGKSDRRYSGGGSGGKSGGVSARRDKRQSAAGPYGRGVPSKAERDEARARAIAAQERESGKMSLGEAVAISRATGEQVPSLADTLQRKAGPTLADMASAAQAPDGPTLADMASAANAGRSVEIVPGGGGGNDLRSRLGGARRSGGGASGAAEKGTGLAAADEAPPGGMFSYAAAKAEEEAVANSAPAEPAEGVAVMDADMTAE